MKYFFKIFLKIISLQTNLTVTYLRMVNPKHDKYSEGIMENVELKLISYAKYFSR